MRAAKPIVLAAGTALVALAGTLLVRSARREREHNDAASVAYGHGTRIQKVFTVQRSADDLYAHWRDFRNLPDTMSHVESVQIIDDLRSRWTAHGPGGFEAGWDAEIIDERPGRRIAWRSIGGSVANAGSVSFSPASGGRGTEVRVEMEWEAPAGLIGKSFAQLFGGDPGLIVETDLRRFKSRMEAGTVALNGTDVKA